MKYLKMLGLAALAAMALTAVIGASTASATVLDKTAGGTRMVVGDTIHANNEGTLTLHAGFATITCTGSTIAGKITNAGSSTTTVKGEITSLTWTGCNCEVKTVKNGTLEVHYTSGTNGTLTGAGSEVTVNCFGTDCIYGTGAGTDLGTVTGSGTTGKTAKLDISTSVSRISGGFLCANPAAWTGSYVADSPDVLNVTAS